MAKSHRRRAGSNIIAKAVRSRQVTTGERGTYYTARRRPRTVGVRRHLVSSRGKPHRHVSTARLQPRCSLGHGLRCALVVPTKEHGPQVREKATADEQRGATTAIQRRG